MTEQPPTITTSYATRVTAAATSNDGSHEATLIDMTVSLAFADWDAWMGSADPSNEHQWAAFTEWLASYMSDRDLTFMLDFPPTPDNIAVYLSRVMRQVAPNARTLTVLTTVGNTTVTHTVQLHPDAE